jgi:acetylornithine deacetylase/succinyl-diaminopimelate desuccinylase-like protein
MKNQKTEMPVIGYPAKLTIKQVSLNQQERSSCKPSISFITTFALLVSITLLSFSCSFQEESPAKPVAISIENLKKHVAYLASDDLGGRGASYAGELAAAKYIASTFAERGLQRIPGMETYLQEFEFFTLGSSVPWEKRKTQNVVAYLKGNSKPNEFIVIGGHHDGQGMTGQIELGRSIPKIITDSTATAGDTIWNSAADNAVSIAGIMEIARILTTNNISLDRSILFTTFSAEESGLDGSTHFVNDLCLLSRRC